MLKITHNLISSLHCLMLVGCKSYKVFLLYKLFAVGQLASSKPWLRNCRSTCNFRVNEVSLCLSREVKLTPQQWRTLDSYSCLSVVFTCLSRYGGSKGYFRASGGNARMKRDHRIIRDVSPFVYSVPYYEFSLYSYFYSYLLYPFCFLERGIQCRIIHRA